MPPWGEHLHMSAMLAPWSFWENNTASIQPFSPLPPPPTAGICASHTQDMCMHMGKLAGGVYVHFFRYKEQASMTGGRSPPLNIGIAGLKCPTPLLLCSMSASIHRAWDLSAPGKRPLIQVWIMGWLIVAFKISNSPPPGRGWLYCSSQDFPLTPPGRGTARWLWNCICETIVSAQLSTTCILSPLHLQPDSYHSRFPFGFWTGSFKNTFWLWINKKKGTENVKKHVFPESVWDRYLISPDLVWLFIQN